MINLHSKARVHPKWTDTSARVCGWCLVPKNTKALVRFATRDGSEIQSQPNPGLYPGDTGGWYSYLPNSNSPIPFCIDATFPDFDPAEIVVTLERWSGIGEIQLQLTHGCDYNLLFIGNEENFESFCEAGDGLAEFLPAGQLPASIGARLTDSIRVNDLSPAHSFFDAVALDWSAISSPTNVDRVRIIRTLAATIWPKRLFILVDGREQHATLGREASTIDEVLAEQHDSQVMPFKTPLREARPVIEKMLDSRLYSAWENFPEPTDSKDEISRRIHPLTPEQTFKVPSYSNPLTLKFDLLVGQEFSLKDVIACLRLSNKEPGNTGYPDKIPGFTKSSSEEIGFYQYVDAQHGYHTYEILLPTLDNCDIDEIVFRTFHAPRTPVFVGNVRFQTLKGMDEQQ